MKHQQIKFKFHDKESQPATISLTNPNGAELLKRNLRTVQGENAINLAFKYSGEMVVTVETARCRWQKRLLFK